MEVGSKSTFNSGSLIIVTVARLSRDLRGYMRTRLNSLVADTHKMDHI